ncbi:MAG: DUF3048 domain-containing protein, partial [Nocardioides sp.]
MRSPASPLKRPQPALVALVAAASLVLAGCGGDATGKDEPSTTPPELEAEKPNGQPADPDTWPLTGTTVADDDSSGRNHPVLVLKMDNTASSAPQVGLGSADLVVEELVEGGMTRLAAFYYSEVPGDVGPVRSMRASDIGIVSPVEADVVTSGAAGVTISRIEDAGIDYVAEGGPGFYRDSGRRAPYNLFTDLEDVAKAAKQKIGRPDDYLPWGDASDLPSGQPATSIAASFGGHVTNWSFRDDGYVNENSYAGDGDEFPADTVLVLQVQVGDAGYRDPAGNPVPETKFIGTGEAMLFHDGRLVRGRWSKKALDSAISLSTQAGELTVPAGRTWIELVPA